MRRAGRLLAHDPAPTVQRPGSTQGREPRSAAAEQKFQQLRRTGSQQDALGYLMEIL
jgi:hypothetical protein